MHSLHIIRSKHTDEWRWLRCFLHRWPPACFQSLHQTSHTADVEAKFARRFNGLDCGTARGADVVDNHHTRAFFLKAFDPAAHAVGFFCFAHQKTMNRSTGLRADDGRGDNDWISAHGQPADSLRLPALLLNEFKKDSPGKFSALGMKRGGTAINVIIALAAGRERE